ncbi:MAG: O-antigen ligase family protein [Actinobacteria bacterium]|nr:O-antigen ligase family protein [Actinomycetota bacterium]
MTAADRRTLTIVALVLGLGGAAYFLSAVGLTRTGLGSTALTVVGLTTLAYLVKTVDPAWLVSGGIVLSMFAGHWDALGVNTNPAPHRVVLFAALIGVLLRVGPSRDRPPLHLTRAHFVLLAAFAYAAVSAVISGTIGDRYSQSTLLDVFGGVPFALFIVAPVVFVTRRQRMILLGSLVGCGAYLCVTGVLEKLKLTALVFPSYIMNPSVGVHFGRVRGPFVDAGADGLALFMCTVAAAVAFVAWTRTWHRMVAAGVLVLAPLGLLATVTRGVWLAAIIGTVVTLATTHGLRRYLPAVAAAGFMAVLVAFALIPGLGRQAHDRQVDQTPVWERQNTTAAGLRMAADRPFIGFGWQRAYDRMEPYFRLDPNIPLVGGTAGLHDIYLQYLVELGVVGLGLWLLAALLTLGSALARRAPPEIWPWQVGLKAFTIAWLVVGLVSPAAFEFTTALLWTWAGIAYGRRDEPVAWRAEPASPIDRRGFGAPLPA